MYPTSIKTPQRQQVCQCKLNSHLLQIWSQFLQLQHYHHHRSHCPHRILLATHQSLESTTMSHHDQQNHRHTHPWLKIWTTIQLLPILCSNNNPNLWTSSGLSGVQHQQYTQCILTTQHSRVHKISPCCSQFPHQIYVVSCHSQRELQHMSPHQHHKCPQMFPTIQRTTTRTYAKPRTRPLIHQTSTPTRCLVCTPHTTMRHLHPNLWHTWHAIYRPNWKITTFIQSRQYVPNDLLPCQQQLHLGRTNQEQNRENTSWHVSKHFNAWRPVRSFQPNKSWTTKYLPQTKRLSPTLACPINFFHPTIIDRT